MVHHSAPKYTPNKSHQLHNNGPQCCSLSTLLTNAWFGHSYAATYAILTNCGFVWLKSSKTLGFSTFLFFPKSKNAWRHPSFSYAALAKWQKLVLGDMEKPLASISAAPCFQGGHRLWDSGSNIPVSSFLK